MLDPDPYQMNTDPNGPHLKNSIGSLESLLLGGRETEGGREENHTQVMRGTPLLVNRLHRGSSLFGDLKKIKIELKEDRSADPDTHQNVTDPQHWKK